MLWSCCPVVLSSCGPVVLWSCPVLWFCPVALWSRCPVLWPGNDRKPVPADVYCCKGAFWRKGIPMVSFVQLQDRQMSGIWHSLLLSYSHLVILFNRFQRSQTFVPGTRNWCFGRRYQCVFFLSFPMYLCAAGSHLSLATFLYHRVCLITANGVLQRQRAASENLFGSRDYNRLVCSYKSYYGSGGWGGGFFAAWALWREFVTVTTS